MSQSAGMIADAVARSGSVAEVAVGRGILAAAGEIFIRHFGPGPACLIADENTFAAAGHAVEAALQAKGIVTRRHILPATPRPKPSVELADRLRATLALDGATPVAIGSGVINDVVKHAAFGLNRPYLCVATAASMDGYTSAGAPLSQKGFKMTIQCRPAKVVLGDLDVIAAAPAAMTGWGYGDLAGKMPAGADWIIADALGIEPVDTIAWPMVQAGLRGWLDDAAQIAKADPVAIAGLFGGLSLVGLAMEAHGSSRPASGADHQIAHLWEMQGLSQNGVPVSHGACVAVGCVAMLALYDWVLDRDLAQINVDALVAKAPDMDAKTVAILAAFGPGEIAARSIVETAAKHADAPALRARLTRVVAAWPTLTRRLRAHLFTADQMRARLTLAGAPASAAEIGVSRDVLHRTILAARFLRSRYTLLDLLDETGLLEQAAMAVLPGADIKVS